MLLSQFEIEKNNITESCESRIRDSDDQVNYSHLTY